MNILKRVKQIVAANLNQLLEKAEDPESMIKQLIREMDANIVKLRMEVAKAIASEKRLERRATETAEAVQKWAGRSEKAVADGDDELARQAIGKRQEAETLRGHLTAQHGEAAAASQAMKLELAQLENKIQEARRRKEILVARKRRAEAQKALLDTTQQFRKLSLHTDALLSEVADAPAALDTFADTVADIESETQAKREVMEASRSLEDTLSEVERHATVEAELAALKAKAKRRGGR